MSNARPTIISSFTYEDLFEFIRRNVKLRQAVDAVNMASNEVTSLLSAIRAGDGNATIFKHPDCDIYLLRLFKEKLIQPTEFSTCYDYLMALDQFYDRDKLYASVLANQLPPLNDASKNDFQVKEVTLRPLAIGNKMTAFGLAYTEKMIQRYKQMLDVHIDRDKLHAAILALSPMDQQVLYIESDFMRNPYKFELLQSTINTHPMVVDAEEKGGVHAIHVKGNFMVPASTRTYKLIHPSFPSAGLRDYVLQTYFESPMACAVRFGSIKSETQLQQQKDNKRIYSLRHRLVASNLMRAHSTLEAAFTIAKHDEVHLFLAAIMSVEYRQKILNVDIPLLLNFVREIETWPDEEKLKANVKSALLEIAYGRLNDFNLFPYETYRSLSQEDRYLKFLANKLLDADRQLPLFTDLTDQQGSFNAIVYLLLRQYYSNSGDKHLWEAVAKLGDLASHPKTILLTTLAKNANQPNGLLALVSPGQLEKINWSEWKAILLKETSSVGLWTWISASYDRVLGLEELIKCGLVYYHPVEPLTPAKQEALLQFVTQQEKRLLEKKEETAYSSTLFPPSLKQDASPRHPLDSSPTKTKKI